MKGEVAFDWWREMLVGFDQWMERLVLANEERFFCGEGSSCHIFLIKGECCLAMASLMEIMAGAVAA